MSCVEKDVELGLACFQCSAAQTLGVHDAKESVFKPVSPSYDL